MGERSEILLRVAIDLECREKRHVEIPRGKSEGGSLVALHNYADVSRAEFVSGTLEAARRGGVGGDRQGPAAEQTIVVEHQIGGGLSRAIRIQALIDDAVDAHIAPRRAWHELPQAGGADARIGGRVERRFHMRKRADFRRHTPVRENAGNALLVLLGADQALVKAVSLTELKTNALDRVAVLRRRGLVAEVMQDAPLMGR